jgi:hypothetical protein
LEEARDRIRGGVGAIVPPSVMPSSASNAGVVYITNPDNGGAVQPWNSANKYFDDELCHENFVGPGGAPALGVAAPAPNVPCNVAVAGVYYTSFASTDPNTGTAAAIPYKWVRVTLKQVQTTIPWCVTGGTAPCVNQNGVQVCADNNGNEVPLPGGVSGVAGDCVSQNLQPVYVITSLAMTNTGARRITQQEVANITVPPLPAALVLDGNTPPTNFLTPNSGNYFINGNNQNSCNRNPAGANLTAIGTISNNDTNNVNSQIPSNRKGQYTGVDGTTPDTTNVESKLGLWSTVGGLEQITTEITNIADVVVPPSGTPPSPPWGTQANPTITVLQGDYNGTCTGYGILLIEGALTCNGNYSWTGVVLVIGKGYVQALNGGGGGQITGGFLVANLYDHLCATGDSSCNSQHQLPASSVPGTDYFNWNGGGGNGLRYDQCEIGIVNNKIGYHILVTREEMY